MKRIGQGLRIGGLLLCAAFLLTACERPEWEPSVEEEFWEEEFWEEESGPSVGSEPGTFRLPESSASSAPEPTKEKEKPAEPEIKIDIEAGVYDRFVLDPDGVVWVYLPDYENDGEMVAEKQTGKAVWLQTIFTENMVSYSQWISAQHRNGSVVSYGGWHTTQRGESGAISGSPMLDSDKKQQELARWYTSRYSLTLDGVLQAYEYSGKKFEPIAQGVRKASPGVLPDGAIYLLYLTEAGELFFFSEPEDGTVHESMAEGLRDFDISGLSLDGLPDTLFLQREDGSFAYGRYWEDAAAAAESFNMFVPPTPSAAVAGAFAQRISEAAAALPNEYPQPVRWFAVTDRTCTVLGEDGSLAYCEYPLVFQALEADTDELLSASVFLQTHSYTQEISAHTLLLYRDGTTICKEAPAAAPVESAPMPPFVRLFGDVGVTAEGELYQIRAGYNDPRNLIAEKLDGLFESENPYMGEAFFRPFSKVLCIAPFKTQGKPWEVLQEPAGEQPVRLPLDLQDGLSPMGDHLLLDEEGTLYAMQLDEILDEYRNLPGDVKRLNPSNFVEVARDVARAQYFRNELITLDRESRLHLLKDGQDTVLAENVARFFASSGMHEPDPCIYYQTVSGDLFCLSLDRPDLEPVQFGHSEQPLRGTSSGLWLAQADGSVWTPRGPWETTMAQMRWPTDRQWVDFGRSGRYHLLLDGAGGVFAAEQLYYRDD